MADNKNGGPAFPTNLQDVFIPSPHGGIERASSYGFEPLPGMSLRDWFAGQALNGILAANNEPARWTTRDIASDAYSYADAMLAERESKP